jgi:hypothetical protein
MRVRLKGLASLDVRRLDQKVLKRVKLADVRGRLGNRAAPGHTSIISCLEATTFDTKSVFPTSSRRFSLDLAFILSTRICFKGSLTHRLCQRVSKNVSR